MERLFGGSETNQKTIIGHPAGLFILFFTEMWERFSYYGMRALLVLFLTSTIGEASDPESLVNPGWGWAEQRATDLYGWYTMLAYLTPIIGGYIADRYLGFKNAIAIGALIMTLGHGFMGLETLPTFYLGLLLLIVGNGLFKPNISSVVGMMYPDGSDKKDGAYTIFYMGVNSGAFLGILLCGFVGEQISWSYGFGLAGIFMFFGMLQFWFARKIFGQIGDAPSRKQIESKEKKAAVSDEEKENIVPFTKLDSVWLALGCLLAGIWIVTGVYRVIVLESLLPNENWNYVLVLGSIFFFLVLVVSRLVRYKRIERDRLIVIAVLSFFTIFFWFAFEQAGTSMTIFAEKYTMRKFTTELGANIFRYSNAILTFIPLVILSVVLGALASKIIKKFPLTIIFTGISFAAIWVIATYMVYLQFSSVELEVPASWFGVLNSFFIITFAPVFSRIWTRLTKTSYNPSGPIKFAIGLMLLGIGFLILAWGGSSIPQGAKAASVGMIWLMLAYLFHTLGELCLSPVGLSYVNKLSPKRLVGFMFGIWFVATAVANKLGGFVAGSMEEIAKENSISTFFFGIALAILIAASILIALNKILVRLMHGEK